MRQVRYEAGHRSVRMFRERYDAMRGVRGDKQEERGRERRTVSHCIGLENDDYAPDEERLTVMEGVTTVPWSSGCISSSALVARVARAPLREEGWLGATSVENA